jgi:hypothetical protein
LPSDKNETVLKNILASNNSPSNREIIGRIDKGTYLCIPAEKNGAAVTPEVL